MSEGLGAARLELRVDLEKFQAELRGALTMVKQTLVEMKAGLNINVDNVNFSPIKDGLKDLPPLANQTKDSVNSALTSFAKFELITGVINQVKGAVGELKNYVMNLGKEYADAELVQEKLRMGLERIGSGDYFGRLTAQADQLHRITPFDDQDITNMQAMLTTFEGISGELIETLTPSMLNLASAFARAGDTGMSLQQIAIMIGKGGATEMTTSLQRVGIVMDETTKKMWDTYTAAERFAAMQKILADNSSITAEAFGQTLAGQIKIAENAFGDIQEAIGKSFAPLIKDVSKSIQALSEWFGGLAPSIQAVIGLLGGMAIAAVALIPILSLLNISLGGMPIIIGAVVAAIAGIAIYITENIDSIRSWVTSMAGGEQALQDFKNTVNTLWKGLQDLWKFIVNELSEAWKEIKDNVMGVVEQFKAGEDSSATLLDRLKTLATDGFEALKVIIHTAIDAFIKINSAVTDFIRNNPQLVEALKWLAEAGFKTAVFQATVLINTFSTLIDWSMRVATALVEVGKAILNLSQINIANVILDPSSVKANIQEVVNSLENVGKAFKNNTQITAPGPETFSSTDGFARSGIIPKQKTTTPGPGNDGSSKDSGSKDTEELDRLKELTAEYDHQVKLMEDRVKLGEASVQQMARLLEEYRSQLEAVMSSLTSTDDRRKAEEKIADLKVKQADIEQKYSEDILKTERERSALIGEVDKFVEKRRTKVMEGIQKETADIEVQYAAMQDKILNSKLADMDKEQQMERLNFERTKELTAAKLNSEKTAVEELRQMRLRNNEDEYSLAVDVTNKKYEKEKERIQRSYEDGKTRSGMLAALEIARIKELSQIQTTEGARVISLLSAGFQSIQSTIGTGFRKMWEDVFGEANTLLEQFVMNVMAQLAEIAASAFFTLILKTVGSAFTGGATAAFASGGYTGAGDPNELAGFVHYDEVVIGSDALKNPGTRQMAELLNQGKTVNDLLRSVIPSFDTDFSLPNVQLAAAPSRGNTINVNIDGVTAQINRLSGLSEKDWVDAVDEIIPKIANGLHRAGKEILDTTFKD